MPSVSLASAPPWRAPAVPGQLELAVLPSRQAVLCSSIAIRQILRAFLWLRASVPHRLWMPSLLRLGPLRPVPAGAYKRLGRHLPKLRLLRSPLSVQSSACFNRRRSIQGVREAGKSSASSIAERGASYELNEPQNLGRSDTAVPDTARCPPCPRQQDPFCWHGPVSDKTVQGCDEPKSSSASPLPCGLRWRQPMNGVLQRRCHNCASGLPHPQVRHAVDQGIKAIR